MDNDFTGNRSLSSQFRCCRHACSCFHVDDARSRTIAFHIILFCNPRIFSFVRLATFFPYPSQFVSVWGTHDLRAHVPPPIHSRLATTRVPRFPAGTSVVTTGTSRCWQVTTLDPRALTHPIALVCTRYPHVFLDYVCYDQSRLFYPYILSQGIFLAHHALFPICYPPLSDCIVARLNVF